MADRKLRVLFICTGNSARSQMAEALMRQVSRGTVDVSSAGTAPKTEIHPMARRVMKEIYGLDMEGQYPKSLNIYLGQKFDYIIAVCDKAAEACPVFPGDPERINWIYSDPAAVEGTEEEKHKAFAKVAREMAFRIRVWLELPHQAKLADKGEGVAATTL